jgi:serine/threonine protein kinase
VGALVAGVGLSEVTNVWFPWLIVSLAQLPCALVWGVFTRVRPVAPTIVINQPAAPPVPETPDYELVEPPIGEGACGRVWLARNAVGEWQALKAVYRDRFPARHEPFESEHRGITSYKPLSDQHPNLLRVEFVSRPKDDTYFYYVMELCDALNPGWDGTRARYKAGDLAARCAKNGGRLPIRECARIGAAIASALHFLHSRGFTHRDVKPENILFVRNEPKLADAGLLREMLPPEKLTWLGTPGYMPPDWEKAGTVAADVYSLGMVLFVCSTGRRSDAPVELATALAGTIGMPARFNEIILTACDTEPGRRYKTADDLRRALLEFV